MKKLHKLILKSYIGPFILTFFISMFVLILQFIWKYIDELVGKGLDWTIIAELLAYTSAGLVPMALPLSILLSSIMTFGNLGEHNELVALKSSGISLRRIMNPLIVVIIITSFLAFLFSNYVLPVANLKFSAVLWNIRETEPTIKIRDGIFFNGLPDFSIRVKHIDREKDIMYDLMIYDHTNSSGNLKVITAKNGVMKSTKDDYFLSLILNDGYVYEEVNSNNKDNRLMRPHRKIKFDKQIIKFDMSGFRKKSTDESLFKGHYQMLNMSQLNSSIDSLEITLVDNEYSIRNNFIRTYFYDNKKPEDLNVANLKINNIDNNIQTIKNDTITIASFIDLSKLNEKDKKNVIDMAKSSIRSAKTYIESNNEIIKIQNNYIYRTKIEWHRKLTLSFACIVLFFIGAPLGAIIRKGGLGLPVVFSIIFFIIFHIISITGEKLVKQDELLPWQGMWLASFVLLPLGVFLTYKATKDAMLVNINFNFINKILLKLKKLNLK